MLRELCPKDGENNEIVIEIRDYEKRLPLILMLMDIAKRFDKIENQQMEQSNNGEEDKNDNR